VALVFILNITGAMGSRGGFQQFQKDNGRELAGTKLIRWLILAQALSTFRADAELLACGSFLNQAAGEVAVEKLGGDALVEEHDGTADDFAVGFADGQLMSRQQPCVKGGSIEKDFGGGRSGHFDGGLRDLGGAPAASGRNSIRLHN
jgi:hypothetical protein